MPKLNWAELLRTEEELTLRAALYQEHLSHAGEEESKDDDIKEASKDSSRFSLGTTNEETSADDPDT